MRLARISSSSSVSRLPMPRSFSKPGESRLAAAELARDGELRPADFLAAEEVADRLDRGKLVVEIGFEVEFHAFVFRGRLERSPFCLSGWTAGSAAGADTPRPSAAISRRTSAASSASLGKAIR